MFTRLAPTPSARTYTAAAACFLLLLVTAAPLLGMPQDAVVPTSESRLQIGDQAPQLDASHWLSGPAEEISEFKTGHVYVLDFWGTWCGACIGEMPELARLQKEFADQKVTIISVTDEEPKDVNAFLDKPSHHDEMKTYRQLTSPYNIVADPDGSVFDAYMKGIEKRSFPMMAIVGKTGVIEYIGSSVGLEPTLKSIVADEWNRESALADSTANLKARKAMMKVNALRKEGKISEAIDFLDQQFKEANLAMRSASYELASKSHPARKTASDVIESAQAKFRRAANECERWERNRFHFLLTQKPSAALESFEKLMAVYEYSANDRIGMAWDVYFTNDSGTAVDPPLIEAAKDAAKAVCDERPENAMCLDIYAHLQFATGDIEGARKTFELALEKVDDEEEREEIQKDFESFLKATGK